jgi:hypothetical protein
MRRWQLRRFGLAIFAMALVGVVPSAVAQTPRAVVGVPIENGKAGKPAAGVIVDVQQPETPRDKVGAPVIIQDGSQGGTTTVRPNFGGGYTVEQDGKPTTTVKPKFGGGYQVQENGKTTTEVTPRFGGGYDVKTKPGASTTVVVPPPDR